MKRIGAWGGLGLVLVAGIILFLSGQSGQKAVSDLPWQIKVDESGQVEVFRLKLGAITLREMIEQFRHFPEIAVFTSEKDDLRLEAYFGKRRMGMLEARIIAEVDVGTALLEQFVQESLERKAQPSGRWKYTLTEANIKVANDRRVRFLVYMPVADYDEAIVIRHFGEPDEKSTVAEQGNYWLYPQKGVAIFMDAEGGDVLYYSSIKDFPELKSRLLLGRPETVKSNG